MSQPVWTTIPGNLGLFPSGTNLNIQLTATPVAPANTITYKIISGSLPEGNITLSTTGLITGIPASIGVQKTYDFVVRATDDRNNIKDRLFSIQISADRIVKFKPLLSTTLAKIPDSTYYKYQLDVDNPVADNKLMFRLSSGRLPPGLALSVDGVISGWPTPPILPDRSPTTKEYLFSVSVDSKLGNDIANLVIVVYNKQETAINVKRNPAILNAKPLTAIDSTDPFKGYYIESNTLPAAYSNESFAFKMIGHDFDKDDISYTFLKLPAGLTGDTKTGWISGTIDIGSSVHEVFTFEVGVYKTLNPDYKSSIERFVLPVKTKISQDVVWHTDSNLGTYHNGSVCDLKISASAESALHYRVSSGSLPPNIILLDTGELIGNFPFQPEIYPKEKGQKSVFTFEVTVSSNTHFSLDATRKFTLTIEQRFEKPVETIYFKAAPNLAGRKIINSLLKNDELIPPSIIYRPTDSNFGKATSVRINHQYGIVASSVLQYLEAIPKNHYKQKFTFGELKTAVARDANGDIIYEVIYCQLIDPAVNENGVSIPTDIAWPQDIGLRYGEWYDSRTDKFTSSELAHTSFSPGYVKLLNPVSLDNMRKEIENNMEYDYDQSLLPKWMTSQQLDGNTLGLTSAWVICHTLPGYSEKIKDRINMYWGHYLSEIDFEIDRFIVDRKLSYNWNTQLIRPNWGNLPSAFPEPEQTDKYDMIVLFNRETILPKT
jgi:hypothetical protein